MLDSATLCVSSVWFWNKAQWSQQLAWNRGYIQLFLPLWKGKYCAQNMVLTITQKVHCIYLAQLDGNVHTSTWVFKCDFFPLHFYSLQHSFVWVIHHCSDEYSTTFWWVRRNPNLSCNGSVRKCRHPNIGDFLSSWHPVLCLCTALYRNLIYMTLTVLVATTNAQWKGMGDVGSARYEPALLPPCPTIRVLSQSN